MFGSDIWFYADDGRIKEKYNIKCGDKTLPQLFNDGKTFNFATEVAPAGNPSVSMTGRYPDFIRCKNTDLYIHFISDDENRVSYRSTSINGNIEIRYFGGRY